MPIVNVPYDKIDDNPYQPRSSYPTTKIEELAVSIAHHGMRQIPEARENGDRYQLAFGHMRKRAFGKLIKKPPAYGTPDVKDLLKAKSMPLDVKEITDKQMVEFAIEENLRRTDISTMDTAKSIELYLKTFKDETVTSAAAKFNMSQPNVSNMLRVLKCPQEVLDKIDSGKINFTMARELLVFQGKQSKGEDTSWRGGQQKRTPKDDKWLMLEAVKKVGNNYGCAATVDGIKKAIYEVARYNFPALEKEGAPWRGDFEPLFDTRAASCLNCEHSIICYETKSQRRHYCTNEDCWRKKQDAHKKNAAVKAKKLADAAVKTRIAEMEQERTAAPPPAPISQEMAPAAAAPAEATHTLKKSGDEWVAIDGRGRVISIGKDKSEADTLAKASFETVATKIHTDGEGAYTLNHTYRIMPKTGRKPDNFESDVTAQDLRTALAALGISPEDVDTAKVWKSSGKPGTADTVSAGWGKCDEPLEEEDEVAQAYKERDLAAEAESPDTAPEPEPAAAAPTPPAPAPKASKQAAAAAKDQAGTRAEVLDIRDISAGSYGYLKQGYVRLDGVGDPLSCMEDPKECTERCTKGFHYAYDTNNSNDADRVYFICSNPKCVAAKKAAFTRAKNADGQAKKKAEMAAIRQAVGQTETLDKPRMLLIIEAELLGNHVRNSYSYSRDNHKETLMKLIGVKAKEGYEDNDAKLKRIREALFKKTETELAKIIVEYMLKAFVYDGDIQRYKINTGRYLQLMGLSVNPERKEVDKAESGPFPKRAGQTG